MYYYLRKAETVMMLPVLITLILCFGTSNTKDEQINVLGKQLEQCSTSPVTGYYRSGMKLVH